MYHNLGKIKPIYKEVLNIDLGDISEIMKAVHIRHDIVHRSGKDKEGKFHIIKKEDVSSLVEKVSYLMSAVSSKLMIDETAGSPYTSTSEVDLPWED